MNNIDLVILVLLLLSSINGLRQGLIHALANLIGWVLALILAIRYNEQVQPWMALLTDDVTLQKIAAFAAIVMLVILLTWIAGYFLHQVFKKLKLSWLNRLAGGTFGLAKSLVVFLVLIHTLNPWFAESKTWKNSKMIALLLPYAAPATAYSKEIVQITTDKLENQQSDKNNHGQGGIMRSSTTDNRSQVDNPFQ